MERVSLLIDGTEFEHWTEFEHHEAIDGFSTVAFKAPFEASRKQFRDLFRPFTYKDVTVKLGGAQLFKGRAINISPSMDAGRSEVSVTAYALAAWLHDTTMPGSKYPVEYKNLGLGAIARAVADPFGITVQMKDDEGAKFRRVRLQEEQKIFEFLAELARQRNLVMSNGPDGNLVFWRSVANGNPVAHFEAGQPPMPTIEASFSPQEYYSEITCFAKATRKHRGSKHTIQNKFLTSVLRPLAFKALDTDPAGAPDAAMAKLGRMFGNMAGFKLSGLPTWRNRHGDVWTANTTAFVTAPNAMIYRKSELLIREVRLKQTAHLEDAEIDFALPGSFSGEIPDRLPWAE